MKLLLIHTWALLLEHLRQPSYLVPTLIFPAGFFLIFGVPEAHSEEIANILMASFSCFAIFGVVFFQFGVGVAEERSSPWNLYLRSLPLAPNLILLARSLCALCFAFLTLALVILVALIWTPAQLSLAQWLQFIALLLLCSIPFAFMGLAFAYLVSKKAALPMANLVYLPLSFIGGLWKPPQLLPESLHGLSNLLPTRHLGEVLWSVVLNQKIPHPSAWTLLGYTAVFLILATWAISKDQMERFR